MQTITEIVAAVVVHSSAAAYSHFGVTLEPHPAEKPAVERSVARTGPAAPGTPKKVMRVSSSPAKPAKTGAVVAAPEKS